MKPIEAIEELLTHQVAQLAAESQSFQFLAAPEEDRYSLEDGHPA